MVKSVPLPDPDRHPTSEPQVAAAALHVWRLLASDARRRPQRLRTGYLSARPSDGDSAALDRRARAIGDAAVTRAGIHCAVVSVRMTKTPSGSR